MPGPLLVANRYLVLRRLGAGGMAEVFLTRQRADAGFERLVVIKQTHRSHAADPVFRSLFLEEARVAADLRHPNVVAVHDFGTHDDRLYLAMEFLHGADVGQLATRLTKRKEGLPLAHALTIVAGVGDGIHYAHQKTDLDGVPLHIVHRDLTPHNVVLTFHGEVKVVDFGIAKMKGADERTQDGFVRGKSGYFAPEQLLERALDHRVDQFALGILLFELTTGRALFRRESVAASLAAVLEEPVPRPSSIVPGYPRALEAIVLRALARDPDARFPDCRGLVDAVDEFAREAGVALSTRQLGRFLQRLFADRLEEDHALARIPGAVVPLDAPSSSGPDALDDTDAAPIFELGSDAARGRAVDDTELERVRRALADRGTVVTVLGARGAGKTALARAVGSSWGLPTRVRFIDASRASSVPSLLGALGLGLGAVVRDDVDQGALVRQVEALVARFASARPGPEPLVIVDDVAPELVDVVIPTLTDLAAGAVRFLLTSRAERAPGAAVRLAGTPRDGAREQDTIDLVAEAARARGRATEREDPALSAFIAAGHGERRALQILAAHLDTASLDELTAVIRDGLPGDPPAARIDRELVIERAVRFALARRDDDELRLLAVLAHVAGPVPVSLLERIGKGLLAPGLARALDALVARHLVDARASEAQNGDLVVDVHDEIAVFARAAGVPRGVDEPFLARFAERVVALALDEVRATDGPGGERTRARLRGFVPLLWRVLTAASDARASAAVVDAALGAVVVLDVALPEGAPPLELPSFVDALLARATAMMRPPARVARAAEARGDLLRGLGDLEGAHASYLDAARAAAAARDEPFAAVALRNAAEIDLRCGRREAARARLHDALAKADHEGDRPLEARVRVSLARLERASDPALARRHAVRAWDICRHVGDRRFEGRALAELAILEPDPRRALRGFDAAIARHRETEDRRAEAETLEALAAHLLAHGDARAADARAQAQRAFAALGDVDGAARNAAM